MRLWARNIEFGRVKDIAKIERYFLVAIGYRSGVQNEDILGVHQEFYTKRHEHASGGTPIPSRPSSRRSRSITVNQSPITAPRIVPEGSLTPQTNKSTPRHRTSSDRYFTPQTSQLASDNHTSSNRLPTPSNGYPTPSNGHPTPSNRYPTPGRSHPNPSPASTSGRQSSGRRNSVSTYLPGQTVNPFDSPRSVLAQNISIRNRLEGVDPHRGMAFASSTREHLERPRKPKQRSNQVVIAVGFVQCTYVVGYVVQY